MANNFKIKGSVELNSSDVKNLTEELDNAAEAGKSLKAQLKEVQQEVLRLSSADVVDEEALNAAIAKAGELKDAIGDANAAIEATAGNTAENLSGALTSMAGVGISAFQGIASAQALFGAESEDLQKVLVKLQALAGLGDAVKSLGGLKDTMTGVKAAFAAATANSSLFNAATVAQAVATGQATVAQRIMNAVMNANPIFLIITGVTALVGAFALFSDSAEDAEKAQEDLNKQMERNLELVDAMQQTTNELVAATGRDTERRIAQLKLQGATQDEIFKAEKEGLELGIRLQKNAVEVAEREYNKALNNRKVSSEDFAKFEKALNDARNKESEMRFQLEMKQLDAEVEAAQKAAEEKKKAADKYAADRKAALERIRAAEQEYADSQLGDQERELVVNKRKYDELIALAKKFGIDSTKLVEAFKNEQNNINLKYAQIEIDNERVKQERINAEKKKAQEQWAADEEAYYEEYRDATQTRQQNEIDDVNEKYFYLIEMAKQYGLDTTELEKKRLEEIEAINKQHDEKQLTASQEKFMKLIEQVDKYSQAVGSILNAGMDLASAISDLNKAKSDSELITLRENLAAQGEAYQASYDEQKASLDAKLQAGVISQEQYNNTVKGLEESLNQSLTGLNEKQQKAELEAKKKAFETDKKLRIAQAIISGAQGAVSAFTGAMSLGFPLGPIVGAVLAAAVVATTAVQVATIKNTKFDSGASIPTAAAGGGGAGAGGGGGAAPTPPSINMFGQALEGSEGAGNQKMGARQQTIRAVVVEADITNTQNRLANYQSRSEVG